MDQSPEHDNDNKRIWHLPGDAAVYLSAMELYRAMNLPEKAGRLLVRSLSKQAPGRALFPQPEPLTGRWFWPQVYQYLRRYHNMLSPPQPAVVSTFPENYNDLVPPPANSN